MQNNDTIEGSELNAGPATKDAAGQQHRIDVEVGKSIKRRRQLLRMSQTALGAAVGVSFQQIQKYERGSNRVSSSILYEIANALGVPISSFFEKLSKARAFDTSELDRKASIRDEFVATEEGQRLVDAFMAVPRKMRPKFISMMVTFGNEN